MQGWREVLRGETKVARELLRRLISPMPVDAPPDFLKDVPYEEPFAEDVAEMDRMVRARVETKPEALLDGLVHQVV